MKCGVQEFCQQLWDLREAGELPTAREISRALALAVAVQVSAVPSYDPYEDRRVEWAQEIVKARTWLKPQYRPEADAALEDTVAWLLERARERVLCGKDLAAGEVGA